MVSGSDCPPNHHCWSVASSSWHLKSGGESSIQAGGNRIRSKLNPQNLYVFPHRSR